MLGPDNGTPCVFSASAAPNTDGIGMPQQSPQPLASRTPGPEWSCPHCDSSCRSENSPSQARIDPNRKCWTTGSFPKTSARYIFTIPWFTLSQVLTCKRDCRKITQREQLNHLLRICHPAWGCATVMKQFLPSWGMSRGPEG